MENTIKHTSILERTGVFTEDSKRRFELTLKYNGIKGKRVLIIGINPASDNIQVFDNTTNYLLNNLGTMGYSEIVVWNLFAEICVKLKPCLVESNDDNIEYLKKLLQSKFDTIIVGWGNTFIGNKAVKEAKSQVYELLKPFAKAVHELVDKDKKYQSLRCIHPLYAGQRFSGRWELRKYEFPKEKKASKPEKEKVSEEKNEKPLKGKVAEIKK